MRKTVFFLSCSAHGGRFNQQLKPVQARCDSRDGVDSSKVGFLEEVAPLRPSRLMTVIGALESCPRLLADTGASLQGHLNLEVHP